MGRPERVDVHEQEITKLKDLVNALSVEIKTLGQTMSRRLESRLKLFTKGIQDRVEGMQGRVETEMTNAQQRVRDVTVLGIEFVCQEDWRPSDRLSHRRSSQQ